MHWLVVRFRGERPAPMGGRSLSKASTLLLGEDRLAWALPPCQAWRVVHRPCSTWAPPATPSTGPMASVTVHTGSEGQATEHRPTPRTVTTPSRTVSLPRTLWEAPSFCKIQSLSPYRAHRERIPQRKATDRRAEQGGDVDGCRRGPWAATPMWKPLPRSPAPCKVDILTSVGLRPKGAPVDWPRASNPDRDSFWEA